MSLFVARTDMNCAREDYAFWRRQIAEANAWINVHKGSPASRTWEEMRSKAFGQMNRSRARLRRAMKEVADLLYAGN